MIGLLVFEQIKESEKQGRRPKEDPKMYEFKPKRLRTTDRHNIAIYIQVFLLFRYERKMVLRAVQIIDIQSFSSCS